MECPVCFETKHKFVWFGCAHHVCADCSARMILFHHTECPFCRFQIKEPVPEPIERQNECSGTQVQVAVVGAAGLGVWLTCVASTAMHMM